MDKETVVETEEITEDSIEETTEEVTEEKKSEKGKKSYTILVYLAVMVLFTLLINSYYFSDKKLSKLVTDDNTSVIYLDEETNTSMIGFVAPYNRVTGIVIKGEVDGEGPGLSFVLLDETYSIRANELPELKDKEGNTLDRIVLSWLLVAHKGYEEPGVNKEAEELIKLLDQEDLQICFCGVHI